MILVLMDSWLFIYFSGIMMLGVGTVKNKTSCDLSIWGCIALYATSKLLLYAWLMERLHIVYTTKVMHEGDIPTSRFKSRAYQISSIFLVAWLVVFVAMAVGRVSYIRDDDGACVIGEKRFATIPMLVVDALVNIYLTLAFSIPIWKTDLTRARTLAIKSSIAAFAALMTSAANIMILTLLHGHQLSFVCLLSCGLDVTLNSTILFLITARDSVTPPTAPCSFVTGGSPFDAKPSGVDDVELQVRSPPILHNGTPPSPRSGSMEK